MSKSPTAPAMSGMAGVEKTIFLDFTEVHVYDDLEVISNEYNESSNFRDWCCTCYQAE